MADEAENKPKVKLIKKKNDVTQIPPQEPVPAPAAGTSAKAPEQKQGVAAGNDKKRLWW